MVLRKGLVADRSVGSHRFVSKLWLARSLTSQIWGVLATDPWTFGRVAGLAACFMPARRARKVDPLVALGCERREKQ